jgi:uncharacterized protein
MQTWNLDSKPMETEREKLIALTTKFVKKSIKGYDSGHDWWHIERVRGLANFINNEEGIADPFLLEITALLHDSADSKFSGDESENAYTKIEAFLDENGMGDINKRVVDVIRNISFSSKKLQGDLSDPVLLVLQDADRLDAIGAVGLARVFNYGGYRNNTIYNPHVDEHKPTTIDHFYKKLLVLKHRMNTHTGKRLAAERHEYLEEFLRQFYKEWEFAMSGRRFQWK